MHYTCVVVVSKKKKKKKKKKSTRVVLFFFLFFPLSLQLYFNLGSIINNVCWFAPANTYYDNIVYIGTAQHYHTLINGYYYLIYLILYNNKYNITLHLNYNQKTTIPYDIYI